MHRTGAEIFLKTKLIRPQPRVERVNRPRLLHMMDRVFTAPLTLVCAPAGYGKTTLLVHWAKTRSSPVAWLSLEDSENDPGRFFSYLILALQQIHPELGKSAQVTFSLPGIEMLENSLRLLVNDLAGMHEPAVLILDDYHLIHSRPVHQLLGFLVEHLPPTFHLVIASRTQPPLAMARLRGRSAVIELRASDLAFQPDEVETFLNQVMDLHLSPEACQQVEKRTEGWAAALQLAALSMQSGENSLAKGEAGSGAVSGAHYIFEYLADEVLSHLPEPVQRFLMRTAILDQASGPLCDALVEPFPPCATGAECLDYLEHASLFTQALDGEHRWYRYHALFADFLRERLKQLQPEIIPELHSKAARWLASQGSFEGACQHALAGKNQDLLVWLIETYAETLEKMGELAILERWVNLLPEHVIRGHARISLARAWIHAARLDVLTAASCLNDAEQALQENDSPSIRSEVLAARAFLAGVKDQPDEVQVYTDQAIRLMKGEKHFLLGLLMINKSFPLMMSGQLGEAIETLEDAVASGKESNSAIIVLLGMRLLGEAYMMNGRLSQAERVFQAALDYIAAQMGQNSVISGMAKMGLGEVYHQRNRLALAEQYLEDGVQNTLTWMPAMSIDGFIWLSTLKQALGKATEAQNLLRQALQINATNTFPLLDGWFIGIAAVRLDIHQGYLEAGIRWAQNTGLDMDGASNLDQVFANTPPPFREMAFYTLARLFLVLGRREKIAGALEKAERILIYILPHSQRGGMYAALTEGLVILAQVEQALGKSERAQEHLHRAMDLAAPEMALRVFLAEGEPLMAMVAERRAKALPPPERAFLETLWAAWESEPQKSTAAPQAPSPIDLPDLPEPLSFREMEVLRWIADGKSNQEIADGLVLSLNTVKKHVSAIIGKLSAKNRMQAVLIARQMGLVQ